MRKIGIPEIEDIATGAALLGAGGGGDPYVGKLVAIGAVQECGPVTLLEPEEVPDDALIVPIAMMSAPTVLAEKAIGGAASVWEVSRETPFSTLINRALSDFGAEKVGFEDAAMTVAEHTAYSQKLHCTLLPASALRALKIVYTPLHGTGNLPVRRVLKELGFTQVQVVPEQELPDGAFPTVSYPNPEDPNAFKLALDLAEKTDADLVLATDPDADRLGVYAKDSKTGSYMPFTGNMSGLLIAEYELSVRKELGRLPKDGALVTTIVSSNMAEAIGKAYDVDVIEVLTGFKYIGEQIKFFEQNHEHTFLFGYEESYGCLVGTHARDKDAVVAVMALCEAAAYYKEKGLTIWDQMLKIYEKYGYYKETLVSITMKGVDGAEKIQKILSDMRANPPKEIGTHKVLAVRDYDADTRLDMETGKATETGLPKSNVLYYELDRDAWCCVRPSGTEPKVKFYMGVKEDSIAHAEAALESLKDAMTELVK